MIPGSDRLLQALANAGGTFADMLWVMDETAVNKHLLQRATSGLLVARPTAALISSRRDSVAIIDIDGVMTKHGEYSGEISTLVIGEAIAAAAADDAVSATVLRIDSPGGHAEGILQLAEVINAAKAKKPIIAHSKGMIASAAYWTASQCQQIYAEPMHLIGSIGTRIMAYDFKQFFDNIGVKAINIDTGAFKSTGAFGTEITPEQVAYVKTIVDDCQAHFTAAVLAGRGFNAEQFAAVADGRVFPVAEALRLGLIDGVQTFEATLAAIPRKQSPSTSAQRSKAMSEATDAPKPATLQELKAELPEATSDFLVAQQMAGATLPQAMKAYNSHLSAELKKSKEDAEAAEVRAKTAEEKAAKAGGAGAAPAKVRGHKFGETASDAGESETDSTVDYRELAKAYQKEHNCRWSEAALAIKKRYPEARAAFGAPSPVNK